MSNENYLEREKEEREFKKQQQLVKFNELRNNSNEGRRYMSAFFNTIKKDETNAKAINEAIEYVTKDEFRKRGEGLYIFGACGTGKTHLACCIINQLMYAGIACKINTIDNIKAEIVSSGFNQGGALSIINLYSYIPVLVIDDLGTEQFTFNGEANLLQSHIFTIINNRYKNMLPTIYTSNLSLEELQQKGLHKKITDRIYETSHSIIELKGKNRRI